MLSVVRMQRKSNGTEELMLWQSHAAISWEITDVVEWEQYCFCTHSSEIDKTCKESAKSEIFLQQHNDKQNNLVNTGDHYCM
jgi:hypothetical protein